MTYSSLIFIVPVVIFPANVFFISSRNRVFISELIPGYATPEDPAGSCTIIRFNTNGYGCFTGYPFTRNWIFFTIEFSCCSAFPVFSNQFLPIHQDIKLPVFIITQLGTQKAVFYFGLYLHRKRKIITASCFPSVYA